MKDFNAFLSDLKTLISFKSTFSSPKEGMPFGEQAFNALRFFLKRAEDMGFTVINYDDYAGEVCFGDGEEVGIIGHLDVVPTGIGWNSDPFTLTEKDGVYYGRGVVDNKSAPLICLYALKELKDSNISPKRKIRLFVGIDEESGWRDVEYLKTKTVLPEYGFSPDGNFPLSYAEKGITEVEFCTPTFKHFRSLSGGTALNAVCDYAYALADKDFIDQDKLNKYGLSVNNGKVESFGKAAHGSQPHLGKNAILPLLNYINDCGENAQPLINLFLPNGVLSGLSNEQGDTTLSPNLLCERDGSIFLTCDCRISAPLTEKDVCDYLRKFNLPFTVKTRHPPMMTEKDGWLVSTLLSSLEQVTGKREKPFSMGGSTFARAFNKGCAFGPEFSDKEYNIHDANECVSREDLLLWYDIYKASVFNLVK